MIPDDYHALYDRGIQAARSAAEAAPEREAMTRSRERLADEIPELVVEEDETTQLPNRIVSRQPGIPLSDSSPDEEVAVRRFLRSRGDLWNLTGADVDGVEVRSVSRTGLKTVRLVQRIDGVEVFDSEVTVALNPANEVLSVVGQLFPGAGGARQRRRSIDARSPEESIARAAFDLTRVVYKASDFVPASGRTEDAGYRWFEFRPQDPDDPRPRFQRPVRQKDVLFPLGNEQFATGHYVELWIIGFPAFSY
jgi:extracellular elastinolytic metalloproteinase